ncbi:MAG: type II secretion system protein [Anaerohalosphaera sp.]|nr:type II secretion system protein [Anaerohalosphaera sp.]
MQRRKGFTLIELLVVISIIAMLLAILMPALGKVKEKAKSVVCRTNTRQLSLAFVMYAMENDDRSMNFSHASDKYWFYEIAPYLGENNFQEGDGFKKQMKISLCPSAPKEVDESASGGWGDAKHAWKYKDITGSYGLNLWLLPKGSGYTNAGTNYEPTLPGLMGNSYKKLSEAKQDTPLVADSIWVGSWPYDGDKVPNDLTKGDSTHVVGKFMGRFCIDRHDMKVNIGFVDGHADTVKLEELWTLKWHKSFATNNDIEIGRN